MQRKLTITLDEQVYEGLHSVVGRGNISSFIEELLRPHVMPIETSDLEAGYRAVAGEEARLGDALYDSGDWEEWGEWYAANPDMPLSSAELEAGYRAMAADEEHESEAMEWVEATFMDGMRVADEAE